MVKIVVGSSFVALVLSEPFWTYIPSGANEWTGDECSPTSPERSTRSCSFGTNTWRR